MPRGNNKENKTNSPIVPKITASPDELARMTEHAKELFLQATSRQEIDLHNPDEVTQGIIDYFNSCERYNMRPGNLGLYAALGLSRQDVNNAITGKSKAKVSPASIDVLKKAIRVIGAYREQLGAQGKINPITLLFWQKNYDGLQDQTQLQISADTTPAAALSPDEIQARIEKDIPIDGDYKDIDP